jgi:hypothetical protein
MTGQGGRAKKEGFKFLSEYGKMTKINKKDYSIPFGNKSKQATIIL